MSLVAQGGGRYVATVATDVSGGVWDPPEKPDMESHLKALILAAFPDAAPGGANPLQNLGTEDGGTTIFVQFASDLAGGDVTTLAGLVQRASEYFVILNGNGDVVGQPIAGDVEPPVISQAADGVTTLTLTLQRKNGDGSNSNGHGEDYRVAPVGGTAPVSNGPGQFDGTGKAQFIVGASGLRGDVPVSAKSGAMPPVPFTASWT